LSSSFAFFVVFAFCLLCCLRLLPSLLLSSPLYLASILPSAAPSPAAFLCSPLPTPLFALSHHPQLIHSDTHTRTHPHTHASSSENAMRQFTKHFNHDASLQRVMTTAGHRFMTSGTACALHDSAGASTHFSHGVCIPLGAVRECAQFPTLHLRMLKGNLWRPAGSFFCLSVSLACLQSLLSSTLNDLTCTLNLMQLDLSYCNERN